MFSNPTLDGYVWLASRSLRFTPAKGPLVIRGWVGSGVGLNYCSKEKYIDHSGDRTRNYQPKDLSLF